MIELAPPHPDWNRLFETAAAQSGLFTTQQAAEAGYSPQLLVHHVRSGRAIRLHRGLYRIVHFPAGEHEDLVAAWLWSERAGVVSHQTALALHELSDALPAHVHLTLPAVWRTRRFRVPKGIVLHHADVAPEDRAWFGPVPTTSAARSLNDCARAGLSPELLRAAAQQALRRGLVAATQLDAVDKALAPFGGDRRMIARTYSSPEAFKQALEARLRTTATTGADFARKRQLLVFDRFLARIVTAFGDAATLKGGLALELRLDRARTTKDVDLRMMGSAADVLAQLQSAGRRDLGDFMTFEIAPDADHPEIQSDGMQYDGLRFRAVCKLAGKLYGQPFGVDVAFGDPIFGEPEVVTADDVLAFAGIAPPSLRLYPIETHIAEKLHAYTMPRKRPNSRVKDLPDIALLATAQAIDATRLRAALEQTFAFRKTHALPASLPEPLAAWTTPYAAMAREDALPWRTLGEVTGAARAFLDPVLAGGLDATWEPPSGGWIRRGDDQQT